MIQSTSVDAYKSLNLGELQQTVFNAFKKYGACTNLEISTWESIPINKVSARTNELVKLGCMIEVCKRKCTISGRKVIAWRAV